MIAIWQAFNTDLDINTSQWSTQITNTVYAMNMLTSASLILIVVMYTFAMLYMIITSATGGLVGPHKETAVGNNDAVMAKDTQYSYGN